MAPDPFGIARAAARERIERAETSIFTAAWNLLKRWGSRLRRVLLGPSRVVDPIGIYSTEQWFADELDDVLVEVREVVDWAAHDVDDEPWPDGGVYARRYLEQARNRLVRVPDAVFASVNRMTMKAHSEGWGIEELASEIDQLLVETGSERWRNRAQTIARTEAVAAYNAGSFQGFVSFAEQAGGRWEKGWLATEDERTRPTHERADLQRVPLLSPFSVGGFPGMFPGDPLLPAQEVINCVVGSTKVCWPGQRVHAATRRMHRGSLVQLVTAEGHDLTVTPNHPVLTPAGYRPAGLLRPGDEVLGAPASGTPEVADAPASAEEVFRALSEAGESERVRGGAVDFHGDGADAEVEIVRADRDLLLDRDAQLFGHDGDDSLVVPEGAEGAHARSGDGQAPGGVTEPLGDVGDGAEPSRQVGGQGVGSPLGGGHGRHADSERLTRRSPGQPEVLQASTERRSTDADFPAHLEQALAAGMTPTKIVKVNFTSGSHWVYNLHTSSNWYTGNGIATHNCRCSMLLLQPGEQINYADRQSRA